MNERPIKKILVANRGEIALRVMRTCRELGIATVAVYSDADRTMPFVMFADEALHIGPSPSSQSYLKKEKIIESALSVKADAIHPGYGFLSENADFARMVSDAGLIFIGPPADSIRAMGDKTEARKLVLAAGLPTVPGTKEPITSDTEAAKVAKSIGYPVLIKAAAGGGGKGMRVVKNAGELSSALSSAASEARSAFGDERVYMEKYLDRPRHIEVQILADHHGNVIHLGERECSIQRRHQKVIEESPSVFVDEETRQRMGTTAINVARACNYANAGTIEFLMDANRNFYFLEMNTRLQVEHAVTELRTGLDLVALQIHVAMGKRLPLDQGEVKFNGHAIECRLCAEDPTNNFMPVTGLITHLRSPSGHGIREDRGVERGNEIPVYYDPMFSKLVTWGLSRTEAVNRMVRALHEYEILGIRTNIPLCQFVLAHPDFVSGDFDTHFLENHFAPDKLPEADADTLQAIAVLCASLESQRDGVVRVDGDFTVNLWKQRRLDTMRSS